jgi:nucleoside-diphosphate-sugar epimerase
MKTILVTGCAGFIGTNLIIRLLKNPTNQIIGVDNLLTSAEPHGIKNERFIFLKRDVVKDRETRHRNALLKLS